MSNEVNIKKIIEAIEEIEKNNNDYKYSEESKSSKKNVVNEILYVLESIVTYEDKKN